MTRHVKRWFELRGRDSQELERRLDTLRQALAAKQGVMLIIKRSHVPESAVCLAQVLYEIPLSGGQLAVTTTN